MNSAALVPQPFVYDGDVYERNMRHATGNSLQVILKVTERCNIACKYCYFFFGGDESYRDNPAYIQDETIDQFAVFLEDAVRSYHLDLVRIIIHGGEPFMLRKARMARLLESVQRAAAGTALEFTVQTNAMLLDAEWIDLLARHRVYVGVSLDGPREFNDLNRVDKRERGTYDRSLQGVALLFEAFRAGRLARPGLLCVLNPDFPAERLYHHFVDEIGFRNIDFLLPDDTHDSSDPALRERYKVRMMELLRLYARETRKEVRFRFADKIVDALGMAPLFSRVLHRYFTQKEIVFTVSSKGDIAPDDILRTTDPALMRLDLNIATARLGDVLRSAAFNRLHDAAFTLPGACAGCDWASVCRGGELYHRYSRAQGFDNPSIYCDTLRAAHEHAATMFLQAGASVAHLERRMAAQPYTLI
jgi:uncharacterized protein